MAISLRPHQSEALQKIRNGTILTGDVGSGKTLTALAYYYIYVCQGMPRMPGFEYKPMQTPKDIYIFTTAKKRDDLDWEKEGAHFGIGRKPNEHGVRMFVDSWNKLPDYKDLKNAFIILDEQRLVGSGAWVKAFLALAKNNDWIMLSATPGDNWMDYIPVFIANDFYKNRTEFIDRHVVWSPYTKFPKVLRFTEQDRLHKLRHILLVEMPFERHTARHLTNVFVDYHVDNYNDIVKNRWNAGENRPIRDASEMVSILRQVVNSDPSRIGELIKLIEKHPKLIIFYNYNYELGILRNLSENLNYTYAEWNGHKHQAVPNTDKWLYLVQYTAGAEGWNCITTNAMVFWSLNYSWKVFHQSQGRIDRLNTPFIDLYYYIFRSSSPIDQGIWKALMGKKIFSESAFVGKVFGVDK